MHSLDHMLLSQGIATYHTLPLVTNPLGIDQDNWKWSSGNESAESSGRKQEQQRTGFVIQSSGVQLFEDSNFHLHGAYIRPPGYKLPFSVRQLPNSRITED